MLASQIHTSDLVLVLPTGRRPSGRLVGQLAGLLCAYRKMVHFPVEKWSIFLWKMIHFPVEMVHFRVEMVHFPVEKWTIFRPGNGPFPRPFSVDQCNKIV